MALDRPRADGRSRRAARARADRAPPPLRRARGARSSGAPARAGRASRSGSARSIASRRPGSRRSTRRIRAVSRSNGSKTRRTSSRLTEMTTSVPSARTTLSAIRTCVETVAREKVSASAAADSTHALIATTRANSDTQEGLRAVAAGRSRRGAVPPVRPARAEAREAGIDRACPSRRRCRRRHRPGRASCSAGTGSRSCLGPCA